MRLIRHISPDAARWPATALAIGNFDGLHRGHQALVRAVCTRADELVPALMCFEPLPASFFRPDRPVRRLLNVRDKISLCRGYGLDLMFMLRFNAGFAALDPDAFARRIVAEGARAKHVVVGSDFRFGARAAGDVEMLERLGRESGFSVQVIDEVSIDGQRVSSSLLRSVIGDGDLSGARHLLGRNYQISGRVLRGRQLGRKLGYPTVNLRPPEPPAATGVFAVKVSGAGLDRHPGVASLGIRPTVAGENWLLEVHLFDYDDNLYGKHLSVEFIEHLRPEEKFEDLDSLKIQMNKDAQQARDLLRHPEP
jgi:riboflavin kinase / FMN adenylyltransferase